jgi:hypothetical protein
VCGTITLNPSSVSVGPNAVAGGRVVVTTQFSGNCFLTLSTPTVTWLKASLVGEVLYSVDANPGSASRTTSLRIQNRDNASEFATLNFTQAGSIGLAGR